MTVAQHFVPSRDAFDVVKIRMPPLERDPNLRDPVQRHLRLRDTMSRIPNTAPLSEAQANTQYSAAQ